MTSGRVPDAAAIEVTRNGPYRVVGPVVVRDVDGRVLGDARGSAVPLPLRMGPGQHVVRRHPRPEGVRRDQVRRPRPPAGARPPDTAPDRRRGRARRSRRSPPSSTGRTASAARCR